MKNFVSIEYLRAFSMLYIVGFWHLFNYTNAFPSSKNLLTDEITNIVLGLFVVISGFLIGQTRNISTPPLQFYKKRLIRIYPLYALAVILFYVYGINNATVSLKSLFFISMYYGPAPLTMWFITMLFLFYLITPLLLNLVAKPVKFLLFILAILSVTLLFLIIFKTVDYRLLLYFPGFCVGIFCARYGINTKIINVWSALVLFFVGLILVFIKSDSWIFSHLKEIPLILSSSYLILAFSYRFEDGFTKVKIVSLLSYSSFAMYLFHRPIYVSLTGLYFPESQLFQVLYLTTICLPIVAFFSWGIQKIYDRSLIAFNKSS